MIFKIRDLLFQVIFYSQLGQEQQLFDFDSVVESICEKLIRRHPHVFSDAELDTDAQIKANWENEKAKERQQKQDENDKSQLSILADIPKNLPALSQAAKIQKRCSHVGFDWHDINDVFGCLLYAYMYASSLFRSSSFFFLCFCFGSFFLICISFLSTSSNDNNLFRIHSVFVNINPLLDENNSRPICQPF